MKFASGTPESAATYEKSLERLTNYLGTQPWKGVSVLTQAIERMENLVLPEPEEPERKYYTDDTRMVTSDEPNNVNNTPRVPVVTDTLYAVLLQKYLTDHARWEAKNTLYKENRSRAYHLFLQHCPTPLRTELKQAEKWEGVSKDHDVIGLLTILRALAHGKKERKQSTMIKVRADIGLYATLQGERQTLDDYGRIFDGQVDVIKANGGYAGYNHEIYQEHLLKVLTAAAVTGTVYDGLSDAEKKPYIDKAVTAACDEYLASLFLQNSDQKRYGTLVKELADDYVKNAHDKERSAAIYPKGRIAMRRVMLDHSGGAATIAPTTTTDSGVAFQEAGQPGGTGNPPGGAKNKKKPWDLCRCCGRKHPQAKDPQKCRNVSQARRDEVAAEIAREEAEKNSPSRPTKPPQQRGTTHTNVQEQDEASESEATGGAASPRRTTSPRRWRCANSTASYSRILWSVTLAVVLIVSGTVTMLMRCYGARPGWDSARRRFLALARIMRPTIKEWRAVTRKSGRSRARAEAPSGLLRLNRLENMPLMRSQPG